MCGVWSKRPYHFNVKVLSRFRFVLGHLGLVGHRRVYRLGVPSKPALQLWVTRNMVGIYQAAIVLTLAAAALISLHNPVIAYTQPNAVNVLGQTNFTNSLTDEAFVSANGMNDPQSTAYDSTDHLLFVADTDNNRVLVYDTTSGINTGMSASYVLGQPDFSSSSCGPTSATSMCFPNGLTYDAADNELFVSDSDNSRILVFNLSGSVSNDMPASYVLGQPDFVTGGCNISGVTSASLCIPGHINYDATSSQLFVSDTDNSRVLLYDLSGGINNGMAASYEFGQPDFVSNGCNNGSLSASTLCYPDGVAYNSTTDALYVSDTSNSRILVYDLSGVVSNGMDAANVLGQADFVSNNCSGGPSELCYPEGLSFDSTDDVLFVAATSNGLILAYDMGVITNDMNATYDIADASSYDVYYDAADQYLFSANYSTNSEQIYDLSGGLGNYESLTWVLGQSNLTNSVIDGATTTSSDMNDPQDVVYDAAAKLLFVADTVNSRILVYDTSTGVINGMAASDVLGQPDFVSGGCNDTGTSATSLCYPSGLAYDAVDNELFVSDSSNSRVLVYDLSLGVSTDMPATYVLGQADFPDNGCSTSSSGLCYPEGLSYDAADSELFVADSNNSRVVMFDLSGGIENDMPASYVLGEPDFNTAGCDSGGVTATDVCYPTSVSYDSVDNDLFVSDAGNQRVLVYQLSGTVSNGMAASDVIGQTDFVSNSCDSGGVTATSLCNPARVYYDAAHQQLFVSDTANYRVLVYDTSNGVSTDMPAQMAVGEPDLVSNNYIFNPATQDGLGTPSGVYFDDSSDTLWVTDQANNRVTSYNLPFTVTISTTSLPDGEVGDSYNQTVQTVYGQAPVTFAITSGVLPDGLTLDSSTGAITGTPTTVESESFTIEATDNLGNTSSQNLSINVDAGIQINTVTLSDAEENVDYGQLNQSIAVSGGEAPYSFAVTSGALPDGLNLDPSSGLITGTPTDLTDTSFTVQVTDNNGDTASQGFSINIVQPISITTSSLPDGQIGTGYDQTIATEYGEGAETFSIIDNSLPPGLNIDSSTGEITGTPTSFGDYSFTVQVVDSLDGTTTAVESIDIPDNITFSTTSLPNGAVNGFYDQTISVNGGVTPLTFAITSGNLPTGLSIDSASGEITGTATTIGVYNFTVGVTDSDDATVSENLSINIEFSYAASSVLGQANLTSDIANSGGVGNGLNYPSATAVDSVNHRLFVADDSNNRVLVYDLDSSDNIISETASYVLGQSDFSTTTCGTVTDSSLCGPRGLAFDSLTNQLFVSDSGNNRVLVYDFSGGITNDMPASFVLGQSTMTDSGCAISATTLCYPQGLDFDATDNELFVADSSNYRVVVYDLSTLSDGQAAVAEIGQSDLSTNICDNGGVTSTSVCVVNAVSYDSANSYLFVSDQYNSRILVYDLSGGINNGMAASYVLGEPDFVTSNCAVSATTLCDPGGLSYDDNDQELFVADTNNNRVMVYDISGGIYNGMPASNVLGQQDMNSNNCNEGSSVSASTLCYPASVIYDSSNSHLFTPDSSNNRGVVYDLSGGLSNGMPASQVVGQPDLTSNSYSLFLPSAQGLSEPNASVVDMLNHRLFVIDSSNSRILVYNLSATNNLISQTASYVLGQPNFSTNGCNTGGISASTLCDPFSGLYFDASNGYLFVADSDNDRVLVYDLSGGISDGMPASYVIGQPDFTTTNTNITQAGMNNPADIAYDTTTSRLFVSDDDASRITVYDLSGGINNGMPASYVLGQPDFTSSNCNQNTTPSATTLCDLYGLYFDQNSGYLYADDTDNSRILVYNTNSGISNDMPASYVLGQPDFASIGCNQNGSETATTLCYPFGGMAVDEVNKNMFVMDSENDRILVYNIATLSNDQAAIGVIGEPDFATTDWGAAKLK